MQYHYRRNGIFHFRLRLPQDLSAGAITQDLDEMKRAVPVIGKAGDISVHHARTLHGSSFNNSNNYRRLLFITARAADAWPITEKVDFEAYNQMMLVGEPCEPRLADVPVILPFPAVTYPGQSIFVKQAGLKNSPFRTEKVTT